MSSKLRKDFVGVFLGVVVLLMSQAPALALEISDEVYGCSWNTSGGGCSLDVPNSNNWFVVDGSGDTATPGAGVEFFYTPSSFTFSMDIGNGTVDITYSCNCGTADFEFAITGIDSVVIDSFALVDDGGLPVVGTSFSDNSMRMFFDSASPAGTKTAHFVYSASPVPEPSTAVLLGGGLLGLGVRARRGRA